VRLVAVQTALSPKSFLGGAIADREFLTRLADRGVQVFVVANAKHPVVEHQNFVHSAWHNRIGWKIPYLANLDVARDLRRLLRKLGTVDWVRFNSPYANGVGTVAAAGSYNIWGSYYHCEGSDYPFRKWVDGWLPARCSLVTCPSEDTRRDIVSRCPHADRRSVAVIPIGIDTARFAPCHETRQRVRRMLGFTPSDTVLLYVGSLIPRKGIDDLIAAWELLRNANAIRLLVIGGAHAPDETEMVRSLVRRDRRVQHIERVVDTVPYYQGADVFVFPTRLEGFGMVVAEAMAAGLPVVTTRAKGVREVVEENETALLADVGRPDQLSTQIRLLLADSKLRLRLGTAGRRRVMERFDWDPIIDSLLAALQSGPE
jgi:glycosyltransferase involved in cell wall biosynthesis